MHYVIEKTFLKHDNKFYFENWWKYAKKTGYYEQINKSLNISNLCYIKIIIYLNIIVQSVFHSKKIYINV